MRIVYRLKIGTFDKKKRQFFLKQNFSEPLEPIFHLAGLSKTYGRVGVFTACCMFYEAECFTHVNLSRKFKGEMGSLYDPCVKAMGQQPYWPSHMEVSYCIFRFGQTFEAMCAHYRYYVIHRAITN